MAHRVSRILLAVLLAAPAVAAEKATLTVMTQNMDAGTDLKILFYYVAQGKPELGVWATYQEVLASRLPERAALLAGEIAAKQPDIVSLQEATLWQVLPESPAQPSFDQLKLLLDALKARGRPYTVVAQNDLTDVTLPMDSTTYVRFLDRDVVIAREGVAAANAQKGLYSTLLDFPLTPDFSVLAKRGWITADVTVSGKTVRVAATHLESTYEQFPEISLLQAAQGGELCALLAGSPYPVIIAGDFNSNAEPTPYEQTPTVGLIEGNGYTDVWEAQHPGAAGFTWPLFLEDPIAPNPSGPYERIDLIFARGLGKPVWVKPIGTEPPFASDHAGAAAKFLLE